MKTSFGYSSITLSTSISTLYITYKNTICRFSHFFFFLYFVCLFQLSVVERLKLAGIVLGYHKYNTINDLEYILRLQNP